jgi:hypothetical protein
MFKDTNNGPQNYNWYKKEQNHDPPYNTNWYKNEQNIVLRGNRSGHYNTELKILRRVIEQNGQQEPYYKLGLNS